VAVTALFEGLKRDIGLPVGEGARQVGHAGDDVFRGGGDRSQRDRRHQKGSLVALSSTEA